MHGGYGTSQMPLAGAILCCTAIPPEQRTALAHTGAQMGATIKLDLTSDVTHLVVGNIDSAKYRYVARSREDVKVLTPEWLEALRVVWMEGGEVDVAALEQEYRLPTFYRLKICLTGFDNPDQRKYIQETAVQHGAEYHGDLTKNVTHLIAATPAGKKYEHARNWRMKVVSYEWFEQSMERGMTLDENYYDPRMPAEERGKGAWERREKPISPTLGKRPREPEPSSITNILRRKLRRSASSKMGSQSEALWAGITAGGLERKAANADDWTEESFPKADDTTHDVTLAYDDEPSELPAFDAQSFPTNNGIFEGRIVFAYSFDLEKSGILREALASNGALVLQSPADLLQYSSDDLKRGYLVVPHDAKTDLTSLPGGAETMTLTTNFWVERCLHGRRLVDPTEHVLCRPFVSLGITGFTDLTVNSTGFVGIELLQLTKAVSLMGGTYDEYLTSKTSVLVCNTRKPNAQKLKFATEKRIAAVHATWLWECLRTGVLQPLDDHMLNTIESEPQKPRQKAQEPYKEVPTEPLSKKDSLKLQQKKAQPAKSGSKSKTQSRNPLQRHRTLDLAVSADPSPASANPSPTHRNTANGPFLDDDDDEPIIGGHDGSDSLPLQDIHPNVTSPRRPSTSSNTSVSKSASTSTTGSITIPNAPPKPPPTEQTSKPTPDTSIQPPTDHAPAPEEKDYSSIMSNILAQRSAAQMAKQNLNKEDDPRKRRRQLGQATSIVIPSNPSTADDPLSLSRTSTSEALVVQNADDSLIDQEEARKGQPVEYQPSQELGWDAPGAQEAREQMIRAMGGKVEGTSGVVEPIGVMKDVVSEGGVGRVGRRKRG